MLLIGVNGDGGQVKKILKHLGLWPVESLKVERDVKVYPPFFGRDRPPKPIKYSIDYSTSHAD